MKCSKCVKLKEECECKEFMHCTCEITVAKFGAACDNCRRSQLLDFNYTSNIIEMGE